MATNQVVVELLRNHNTSGKLCGRDGKHISDMPDACRLQETSAALMEV